MARPSFRRRKRRKKTEGDSLRHAQRRAAERYGLHLSFEQLQEIGREIRDSKHELLYRESNTRTIYRITGEGVDCVVVYNKALGCLATFLKPEWVDDLYYDD